MIFEKLVDEINKLLPFDAGTENDKLGIQIKSQKTNLKSLLVIYELTKETLEEIKELKPDCIISFHPLIYAPLSSIEYDERVGALVLELAKLDISFVVCHTNFDSYKFGPSWLFANQIGLNVEEFLIPHQKYLDFGIGVYGSFQNPLLFENLLDKIYRTTYSPLRWCKGKAENITTLAIVAGSGMHYANIAYQRGADAFVSADISYHNFHKFNGKMMLIDPGHWEMEYPVPFGLGKLLTEHFNKFGVTVYISKAYTNPVNYYPSSNLQMKQIEIMSQIQEKL
ncbi:MAG: Nif3-like dinuclear metal center hexameric protein [Candidatus Kapaibacteriales bacterium]